MLALKREKLQSVFDTPELQKHQYDLRAVLFQDGLYGRNHAYSYVRDYRTNIWWRTIDHEVVEMTEEGVFNDHTGLHMGGGPYFLIYSRRMNEASLAPESWPERIRADIRQENVNFRGQLTAELAAALEEAESPDLLDVMVEVEEVVMNEPPPLDRSTSYMSLDEE